MLIGVTKIMAMDFNRFRRLTLMDEKGFIKIQLLHQAARYTCNIRNDLNRFRCFKTFKISTINDL